jgi:hypothetical protein
MDIFEILKKDHEETLELFRKLEETTPQDSDLRRRQFSTLNAEFLAHLQAEEDTFYPPLLQSKHREDALEAVEEHHVLELVLRDLRETEPGMERWKPKLRVLKEIVEHHIQEEEGKIFTEIKTILSKGMAEELGVQFSARKGEILSETDYS